MNLCTPDHPILAQDPGILTLLIPYGDNFAFPRTFEWGGEPKTSLIILPSNGNNNK